MNKIRSELDLEAILKETGRLSYWLDGTGTEMAKKQSEGLFAFDSYPEIHKACMEVKAIRGIMPLHVMINIMKPGRVIPFHKDFLKDTQKQGKYPCLERWHLPLITNDKVTFSTKTETLHMELGFWHGPVEYWKEHAAANFGTTERIHLIVDLDSERIGNYE